MRVSDILKPGRKWVICLRLICCVNMMWAVIADQSWNDGTSGQIWNNDLLSPQIRQLTQIPLRGFLWASWTVPSPQCLLQAPPASTSLRWAESILSSLYPLSLDTSAALRAQGWRRWQLTGLWDFNSGPDFNRFCPQEWFPVAMRDANAPQQPHFSHLSRW